MKRISISRKLLAAALALGLVTPAVADPQRVASDLSVSEAVARITAAVDAAGWRIFNTVDFQAGNARVGAEIRPTVLVLFGSPKIGAEALQIDQTLALQLPLRVLAYEDAEGRVWVLYPDPETAAVAHGVPADHPAVKSMRSALTTIADAAAG